MRLANWIFGLWSCVGCAVFLALAAGIIPLGEDEANTTFCWLVLTLIMVPFGYTAGAMDRVGLNSSRYAPKEHQARFHRRLTEVWRRIPLAGTLVVVTFVLTLFAASVMPLLPLAGIEPPMPSDRQFVFISSALCLLFDLVAAVFNLRVIPRCQDLIEAWAHLDRACSDL